MDHIREHRSVLADGERRLLIAIARRLPRWINSDHLTLIGLLSMPLAALAFANIPDTPWSAAAFVLALAANWFGDSLDGTVARVRNQQRPRYGYYVDHVIDLVGTAALFTGIAWSGLMHPAIAIAVVAAYFLVAAESFLTTHAAGVFRISFAGFGPTELRVLLAIGAIVVVNNAVGGRGRSACAAVRRWRSRRRGRHDRRVHRVGDQEHAGALSRGAVAGRCIITTDTTPCRLDRGSRWQEGFAVSLVPFALGAAQRVRAVRFTVFLVVGWFGFALQLSVLAFLTSVAHWPWLPATIVAVELAVVHNFLWHERHLARSP